jgi:hypothetical protein
MNDIKTISYPCEGHNSCYQIEESSFWFRQRNKIIAHVVDKYSLSGTFADVGGGNGFVTSKLQGTIPHLDFILVEPGENGCKNATSRGVKKVFNKTLDDLVEFQILENVGLFDVLEHIKDDEGFLKSVRNKLPDGGKIFMTVPAYNCLWSSEDEFAGHFRRYDLKKIKILAEKADLKLEYANYFFAILTPLIFFLRVLPEKIKCRKQRRTVEQDHQISLSSKILEKILSFEISLLKKGFFFPFGASIVVCLSKKASFEKHQK